MRSLAVPTTPRINAVDLDALRQITSLLARPLLDPAKVRISYWQAAGQYGWECTCRASLVTSDLIGRNMSADAHICSGAA